MVPIGTRLIDSTPQPMPTSMAPAAIRAATRWPACWPEPHDTSTVRLWLAKQRAAGLRRRATVVEERTIDGEPGDVVELEVLHTDSAASWIAGYGPDAVVLEPDVLRKAVHERLLAVAEVT